MALRFNPPPNWPAPPEGFNPPAGWQPDPAWGPAPEGWQLWVEDSVPGGSAGSAPQTSSAADAAWAPTQAVSTGSAPVADPTGQSASAPSGDYAASAPMVGSGSAPVVGSSPGASPYAPGMNYAQAPTPYHSQGVPGQGLPGGPPQGGPGWQPVDVSTQGGSKSVVGQWWFWLIIAVLVIALVGGGLSAILTSGGGGSTTDPTATSTTSATSTTDSIGSSEKNPREASDTVPIKASPYSTDPDASLEVTFGVVDWDATQQLKDSVNNPYSWQRLEPPAGSVYIRVPVSINYHGTEQYNPYNLHIEYVQNGNTVSAAEAYSAPDEFISQNMPYDGGSATGYFSFLLTKEQAQAKDGVWAVKALYNDTPIYIKLRQ